VVLDDLTVRGAYHKLALQYGSAFPWNRLRYRSSLVILLRAPSESCIRRFLEEQRSLPFSYPLYRRLIVTGFGNSQEPILAYLNVLEGEGLAEKESGWWRR
jgi:hypothetical protein